MESQSEHTINIDNEMCHFWVVKKSKTVWHAYGEFRGKMIDKTGDSARSALNHWKEIADSRANE